MDSQVQEYIKATDALHKANMQGFKNDILDSVRAIRADFELSKNDNMDEVLGEIYRNHLENIFKIIDR